MQRRAFLRGGFAAIAGPAVLLPALPSAAALRASPQPRRGFTGDDGVLHLDANENPLGIPDSARGAVVEGLAFANRYPGEVAGALRSRLESYHGLPVGTVVLGNGSTEVLQMVVQAYAAPGVRLVVADPTFEHATDYAAPSRLEVVKVPLTPDFAHDLQGMRAAARPPALVYVCNPNNPTGSLTDTAQVEEWLGRAPDDVVFLIDEAYFHYAEDERYHTLLEWTQRRRNVVVVRTFSKIYGLAGLRLGYGVAHPETARRVGRYAADVNANQLAVRAADAALEDDAYIDESIRANRASRRMLEAVLDELDLERIPSHTNFVMHRVRDGVTEYRARMQERDIRVGRPFPPMLQWNRVSLGLPEEMERLVEALGEFRRRGWV